MTVVAPEPVGVPQLEQILRLFETAESDLNARLDVILARGPEWYREEARLRGLLSETRARMVDLRDALSEPALAEALGEVYATGATDVAGAIGDQFGWSQAHLGAVNRLASDTFEDLLTATTYVEDAAKAVIRDAARLRTGAKLLQGQTAVQAGNALARQLRSTGIGVVTYRNGARHGVGEYSRMVLRTKTAVAYNMGTLNHSAAGGVQAWEIADGSDCGLTYHDDPTLANGMIVDGHTAAAFPIAHPNAVLEGSTFAPYGACEEMIRARYAGPAVLLTTGLRPEGLTIGPNHPVLTDRGMVPAKLLREGDKVAHDVGTDRGHGSSDPDLVQMPRVEDVFEAALTTGDYSTVPASRHDFHGDARFVQSKVEVVRPTRNLLVVLDSGRVEELRELALVRPYAEPAFVPGARPLLADVETVRLPAASGVGGGGSLSAHVAFLPLLSKRIVHFEGWAFDATTITSLYCSDGLVVSNCRRVFLPRTDLTAMDAGKFDPSTTEAQRADQAAFERFLREQQRNRGRSARPRRKPRTETKPKVPRAPRTPRKPTSPETKPKTSTRPTAEKPTPPGATQARSTRSVLDFEDALAEERLGPLADNLDRVGVRVPDSLPQTATKTRASKRNGEGGYFTNREQDLGTIARQKGESAFDYKMRQSEAKLSMLTGGRYEIVIREADATVGEVIGREIAFYHEFGHRLDFLGSTTEGFFSEMKTAGLAITDPEAVRAMTELLSHARNSEPLVELGRLRVGRAISPKSYSYLTEAAEVWARAFSQWAAYAAEDANAIGTIEAMRGAFSALPKHTHLPMQWSREEFEREIGPYVEKVLRARGIIE